MSSNTSTRFAFCVNTARFLINRVLCCSRRATRRKSSATFRLNALMACRLLSATEHHTLQQAGRPSGARGKRRKNGGDEEALCPRDLLQQTQQHCENSETYCYSDRKSRFFFFFETVHPCVHAWGVHTVLWEGFELTQVTVAPSPVWRRKRRRRGDELFNQPALLGSEVLLCLMGRWGNNKQHLLTRRAAIWQPQDRASKEPRFSRGQGIISESSSRIIARSQNDSPSLRHSITDCCSITPHTQRINWQPCPADSKASQPA